MKGFLVGLGIFAFVVFIFASSLAGSYNGLVNEREQARTAQAQVETQLQRRFDLIPNVADSAKAYMQHEEQVFKDIADARTKYAGAPSGSDQKVEAANGFESAFARLMVIMENYPNLKADATIRDLMTELEGTENRISVARQRYNEDVQVYNAHIQRFPTNILAGMFGMTQMPRFEATSGAEVAPKLNLSR